jgi:hypothetical protein
LWDKPFAPALRGSKKNVSPVVVKKNYSGLIPVGNSPGQPIENQNRGPFTVDHQREPACV